MIECCDFSSVIYCHTCRPASTACTRPWRRWSRSSGCRSSGRRRGRPCCPPAAAPGWTEAGWRAGSGPAPRPRGWARSSAPGPGPPAGWRWSERTTARSRRWSGCVPASWCTLSPWWGETGGDGEEGWGEQLILHTHLKILLQLQIKSFKAHFCLVKFTWWLLDIILYFTSTIWRWKKKYSTISQCFINLKAPYVS